MVARKAKTKDMLELFCNITWERTSRWDWWSEKENGYTEGNPKKSQHNIIITSFYDPINGDAIIYDAINSNVKVFSIEAEEIRNVAETNLGTFISAAPALPGIFNAHHLQHTDGKIHLKPYSTATYCVNQLGLTSSSWNNLSVRSSENTKTSQVDDVKTGSFIIVTYEFASASSSKYVNKRLVALVTSGNKDESTVEVQYATAISKW